ncbi:MAG: phosphatase PAP2 family protein [Kineosporiaceae bacterium]|nr:phosphatase PAP2 family protein [Aeromicrobium sp.]
MSLLRNLDDRLFFAINAFARHTGWLHATVLAYAKYGVVLFGLLLLVGLLYARARDSRTLAAAAWVGIATLLALAVNQPITHLFHEARPYITHPHILLLTSRSPDYSFPSDHAVMAGAVASGLLLVSRRLGMVAVAAAVVMAFSRVYVAAHYPWDVLVGLLLGAGIAGFGWLSLRVSLISLTSWLRRRPGLRTLFTKPN